MPYSPTLVDPFELTPSPPSAATLRDSQPTWPGASPSRPEWSSRLDAHVETPSRQRCWCSEE